jgi:SAM-dependent methyltransferase
MSEAPYETNRRWWDERAGLHPETPLYRQAIERLRRGEDTLLPLDDEVLGELAGLDVLHLQCHIGTDTLSLARRGARPTGVDFSSVAVTKARALADELGLEAEFVESDVYTLPQRLRAGFDLVYTSYGALCWLGDLGRWAAAAAACLRPGGRLVLIDSHPLALAMAREQEAGSGTLRLDWPYLQRDPVRVEEQGSYAAPDARTRESVTWEWAHGLAAVVQAVVDAGLALERLTENDAGYYPFTSGMVRSADGLWYLPTGLRGRYPLTYTLVARRSPALRPAQPC